MRRTLTVMGLVLGAAGAARAQSPELRAELEALRAELAASADSTALLAREHAGIALARQDRENALVHLWLGFLAYRLGEITGVRQHYDDAAGEFEWAAELEPDWPYAWYGLGLSELALGESSVMVVENLRQALGKDYLSKAARAFARAAEADPGFARAVIDLADAARRQRVRPRLEVAQRALRAAAATDAGRLPALQLARGRIEREMGEGDSALAAFAAYLAVGGDRALGLLEQARTLFYVRRPVEGREAYYAGAENLGRGRPRAEYRADLQWIATDADLARFDAAPAERLSAWLAEFWTARDALDGRASGERLAEHYRRLFYAVRQFRLTSPHRQYGTEPFRSTQDVVDDRGVIYIRHGEPDERARHVALEIEPNESWVYRRPLGDLIFHFVARGDVQDYKLVESLLDVFGTGAAIQWQAAGRLPPQASALLESRAHLDAAYGRLAQSGTGQGTGLAAERRRGRDVIKFGTTTDSYRLWFDRPLQSRLQAYAVGGADSGARLLFVFAVPGNRLSGHPRGGTTMYPLEVRLVRVGPERSALLLDTTRVFRSATPLEPGQYLSGYLEVPIEPGMHELRAVVLEPETGAGDVIDITELDVPRFDAGGLVLSDLVLGERDAGLLWRAAGDSVPLSPLGAYPQGGTAELYYEVHGLPVGSPYRVRIEVGGRRGGSIFAKIGRLFGGGRPPVAFAFDGIVTDAPLRARQTVNLAPLAPGEYTLRLTVEDPSRDVRHTRDVRLRVLPR
ncbi:MAG: GWxTD domain-containing protein [Gemmatimonadota bacterium]|nr:GWxTD domain-containing protein [Gemmatimonadota bacterium]